MNFRDKIATVSVLLLLALPLAALAQKEPIPFLNPQQAIDKMTYPKEFNVKAYAAEPHVVQPFAFCFDNRGRLWVTENRNYRTRGSDSYADGPQGRILILEDTDGDGEFDVKKLFKDKIFFPTGLAVGFGGVWVGSPPNLLFIPDKDEDDRPDGEPQVVLDGWGRHDRHETLNSFLWGPDGWLYGCHGVFTHSNVGKPGAPDDERARINAGVWRYHPTKEKFEVFAWGTSNPWGLDFDDHGQAFITACVIPHLWHIIQGGHYQRQSGRHFNPHVYNDIKTIADHRHKSAHGGARFYLADGFPEKYRGRLFMCNLHQHDIMTDILERKGSGFVGKHGDDFLQSNDPQWLGFNMEIGPEGAIYVIDWHDADICGRVVHHEETGRIWRIAHKDTRKAPKFNLSKSSDAELVDMHLHANDWYVRQARRILQERAATGKLKGDTHKALWKLFQETPAIPRKLRALWSLHVSGGLSADQALGLLKHENEYVRAWSIQFLSEDRNPSQAARDQFASLAKHDPSALVRLYLTSACQRMPVDQRWPILENLAGHEEDKDDHNLPLMIWYALEPGVEANRVKALAMAKSTKLSLIRSHITRRITAGLQKIEKEEAKKVPAAKSVSNKDLAVWLRSDWGVRQKDGGVTRWIDRTDSGHDAWQNGSGARPKLVENLNGRKAIQFDGTDDHLVVSHDPMLSFRDSQSYSLSTWVHVKPGKAGWIGIVAKSRERSPWYGLWINPENEWTFGGSNKNMEGPKAKSGWRHVCIVQKGDGGRYLYVDGAQVASGEAVSSHGNGDMWLGGAKSTREYFQGGIGEIRLYRRALSHPEVAHLAENP